MCVRKILRWLSVMKAVGPTMENPVQKNMKMNMAARSVSVL